jgi:oligopeptide/dipeptide ABC transporter ATP-binding protein
MYLGRIVETAPAGALFERPFHPYTEALISAIPGGKDGQSRIVLKGDPPSPQNPPTGCHFHPRCHKAFARCAIDVPHIRRLTEAGITRSVACHLFEV